MPYTVFPLEASQPRPCRKCGSVEKYVSKSGSRCKPCRLAWVKRWQRENAEVKRAWKKANWGKHKAANRKHSTGWTPEAFEQAWSDQNGACAICQTPLVRRRGRNGVASDHNHVTKKTRALLCTGCNCGLGQFSENPERLRAAALYLESYS